MSQLDEYLNINGIQGAWIFDEKGAILDKTVTLGEAEKSQEISRLMASVCFMYGKNTGEPVEQLAYHFDDISVWARRIEGGYLGLMVDKKADPTEIHAILQPPPTE